MSVVGKIHCVKLFTIFSVEMLSSIFVLYADSIGTVNDLQNIDFLLS